MHAAPPAGQPLLLDRITHQYAGHKAVDGITLDIGGGELVALLGPSGCGKTTLLRIVAGLAELYPVARSAHYKDLIPVAQEPDGPAPFFQVVGLTYNPETVKAPSTSWADLWNPVYKNRVGITNLASTLGTGFLVEVARMRGGSETNVEC